MRILLLGSGGREHALAWKLRRSERVTQLYCAPGNGGTAEEAVNLAISDGDIPAIMRFVTENSIDFVIPGPELPLVLGIVDACKTIDVPCFGPDAYAAQLEGSKVFSKTLMREAGVPTADFMVFSNYAKAVAYVEERPVPIVIKADGLAAGKGVVVAKSRAEAREALKAMMVDKIFGDAGARVIVEEALQGEEVSFLCMCDGETVIALPSAQDHKAVFDGDQGPNTGGMGAYSPAPILPQDRYEAMADCAIRPVLRALKERGHPFSGILYAGFMMTQDGPMVLEYNTRFGDPECQPLLMRLQGDLVESMYACATGSLHTVTLTHSPESALCVVMTAPGYPGEYSKGLQITGLAEAEALAPGKIKVFQAGTAHTDGGLVSTGGRVLGVTALGDSLREAQDRAYAAVKCISMAGCHYRTDIGAKAL